MERGEIVRLGLLKEVALKIEKLENKYKVLEELDAGVVEVVYDGSIGWFIILPNEILLQLFEWFGKDLSTYTALFVTCKHWTYSGIENNCFKYYWRRHINRYWETTPKFPMYFERMRGMDWEGKICWKDLIFHATNPTIIKDKRLCDRGELISGITMPDDKTYSLFYRTLPLSRSSYDWTTVFKETLGECSHIIQVNSYSERIREYHGKISSLWKNGIESNIAFHGQGHLTVNYSTSYSGNWKSGLKHGMFIRTSGNRRVRKGLYKNDVKTGLFKYLSGRSKYDLYGMLFKRNTNGQHSVNASKLSWQISENNELIISIDEGDIFTYTIQVDSKSGAMSLFDGSK